MPRASTRHPPIPDRPGASACSPTTQGASGAPRSRSATTGGALVFRCISDGRQSVRALSWTRSPSRGRRRPAATGSAPPHASAHSHSRSEVRACESIGDRRSATSRWSDTGRAARPAWSMRSPSCPAPVNATAASPTAPPSPTPRPKRSSAATPSTSAARYAEWMDTKINLLDTPGFLDFQGDAIAGLAAADGALCVVERDGRRRGRHRADVPRSGLARRPGALRRHDDGQGARGLRRDLPADQVAPHAAR